MRQRLRPKLTYANVMVSLLTFIVLGGGTALGAVIVSSNSQIGPETVSGHHAPRGAHPNIISASLNGTDVQDLVFQNLTLNPGWTGGCYNSGDPAVAKSVEGVVYLRGAMCRTSGSSDSLFILPPAFRPTKPERLVVSQPNGLTGDITIAPTGNVFLSSDPADPSAGGVRTSLAGVSYTLPF
jgi:hypothetical protein